MLITSCKSFFYSSNLYLSPTLYNVHKLLHVFDCLIYSRYSELVPSKFVIGQVLSHLCSLKTPDPESLEALTSIAYGHAK